MWSPKVDPQSCSPSACKFPSFEHSYSWAFYPFLDQAPFFRWLVTSHLPLGYWGFRHWQSRNWHFPGCLWLFRFSWLQAWAHYLLPSPVLVSVKVVQFHFSNLPFHNTVLFNNIITTYFHEFISTFPYNYEILGTDVSKSLNFTAIAGCFSTAHFSYRINYLN